MYSLKHEGYQLYITFELHKQILKNNRFLPDIAVYDKSLWVIGEVKETFLNDRAGYIPAIISIKSVSPSLMIAKFEYIIIAI